MSIGNDLELSSSIQWKQRQNIGDVIILEDGSISYNNTLLSGTGNGQVNSAFALASGLPSGGVVRFDLFNLTRNIFGHPIATNFSGGQIKQFFLKNLSTGNGHHFMMLGTGVAGYTHLFSYSYLGVELKPQSYISFNGGRIGHTVTSGDRYIYLWDCSGSGCRYNIGIFGVI